MQTALIHPRLLLSLVLTVAVGLIISDLGNVNASEPPTIQCSDANGNPINRRVHEDPRFYTKIFEENNEYSIAVNPQFYYLSRETQEWLYLRECARIRLDYDLPGEFDGKRNPREERKIDCEALQIMATDSSFYRVERQIKTIERDLEELDSRQWQSVFGGNRRRTDLYSCVSEFQK